MESFKALIGAKITIFNCYLTVKNLAFHGKNTVQMIQH